MKRNVWKTLFFILLSLNIIIIGTIIYKILSAPSYDNYSTPTNNDSSAPIHIVADNSTVEKIINDVIDDDNMYVNINDTGVHLETTYDVLKQSIPVNVSVEPLVKDDKIILQLKDIDIARFSVSMNLFYDTLKKHIDLGEGMSFNDDSPEIIVDSKVFSKKLDYDVTIDKIDIKQDKWYFSVDGLF